MGVIVIGVFKVSFAISNSYRHCRNLRDADKISDNLRWKISACNIASRDRTTMTLSVNRVEIFQGSIVIHSRPTGSLIPLREFAGISEAIVVADFAHLALHANNHFDDSESVFREKNCGESGIVGEARMLRLAGYELPLTSGRLEEAEAKASRRVSRRGAKLAEREIHLAPKAEERRKRANPKLFLSDVCCVSYPLCT